MKKNVIKMLAAILTLCGTMEIADWEKEEGF